MFIDLRFQTFHILISLLVGNWVDATGIQNFGNICYDVSDLFDLKNDEILRSPFSLQPFIHEYPLSENKIQQHGTTTLAFIWQNEVLCAVDSRASVGDYVGSSQVKKIFPISKTAIATMAGGAADCSYWIRRISREVKLLENEYGGGLPIRAVAKFFANVLRDLRQLELSVGTMVAGVDVTGPSLYYLDNDGNCIKGDYFCVGSGSSLAYAILDSEIDLKTLPFDKAIETAAWAVRHATHRDGYSGGFINVFRINDTGCHHVKRIHARHMTVSSLGSSTFR